MLIGFIVNIVLILFGYYLGLKKAQEDLQRLINESTEIREAWERYLLSKEAENKKDHTENDTGAPEGGTVTISAEDVEDVKKRVYKSFNITDNIGGTGTSEGDPEEEGATEDTNKKSIYNKYTP